MSTKSNPWAINGDDAPAICLPDRSGEPIDVVIDSHQLPIAELMIATGAENPLLPVGVAVIVGGRIVARLELEVVKDAAKQIDAMEIAAEHHGHLHQRPR